MARLDADLGGRDDGGEPGPVGRELAGAQQAGDDAGGLVAYAGRGEPARRLGVVHAVVEPCLDVDPRPALRERWQRG